MKYLGIDYGTKRVGIATSDDSGRMAFPCCVLPNTKTLVEDIAALCAKERIQAIVVGDSRDNRNQANPIMSVVIPFSEELKRVTGLPLSFMNEAFSSREAMHVQGDNAHNDASAAAIVLQSFLDRVNPSTFIDNDDETL